MFKQCLSVLLGIIHFRHHLPRCLRAEWRIRISVPTPILLECGLSRVEYLPIDHINEFILDACFQLLYFLFPRP